MAGFTEELEHLINRHSMENGSNTPDFILARFMDCCLQAFNRASGEREAWYGHYHSPGGMGLPPDVAKANPEQPPEVTPPAPAPAEEKWMPKVNEKCLCTKPPSDLFKDDQIEVVPRCIGKHWSWVGLLDHAGVDDLTNGLLVSTDSLRPLPPEPPVRHGEILAVEKDGYVFYGKVQFTDSGRKVFKITGGDVDEEFRWDEVTITHLAPEPKVR